METVVQRSKAQLETSVGKLTEKEQNLTAILADVEQLSTLLNTHQQDCIERIDRTFQQQVHSLYYYVILVVVGNVIYLHKFIYIFTIKLINLNVYRK